MNSNLAMLLPMWILGTPLLLGILELMRTPRPVTRAEPVFGERHGSSASGR